MSTTQVTRFAMPTSTSFLIGAFDGVQRTENAEAQEALNRFGVGFLNSKEFSNPKLKSAIKSQADAMRDAGEFKKASEYRAFKNDCFIKFKSELSIVMPAIKEQLRQLGWKEEYKSTAKNGSIEFRMVPPCDKQKKLDATNALKEKSEAYEAKLKELGIDPATLLPIEIEVSNEA